MMEQFDFSKALALLKQGKQVRRMAWGETAAGIGLSLDRIVRVRGDLNVGPWHSPDCDILATDWVLVEEPLTRAES